MKFSGRFVFLMLFVICTGLLGFGLYLQYAKGTEPCPMCIMQRYAFIFIALMCLIAGLQNPGRLGQRIYSALLILASLTGAGIAVRQSWLQMNPTPFAECGPDMAYMINTFPISEALPMIFSGSGDCSKVDWSLFGLSIANWSFLCFLALCITAILIFSGKYIRSSRPII